MSNKCPVEKAFKFLFTGRILNIEEKKDRNLHRFRWPVALFPLVGRIVLCGSAFILHNI